MIKKLQKSKAGFTLVELIVVIAIIGVLAAVLAPQYIKYVEKSRAATDESNLGTILTAIQVATSDENLVAGVYQLNIAKATGAVTAAAVSEAVTGALTTAQVAEINDTLTGNMALTSTSYGSDQSVTITVTGSGDSYKLTFDPSWD